MLWSWPKEFQYSSKNQIDHLMVYQKGVLYKEAILLKFDMKMAAVVLVIE